MSNHSLTYTYQRCAEKESIFASCTWTAEDKTPYVIGEHFEEDRTLKEISEEFKITTAPIIADPSAHDWHVSGTYIKPKGN